MRDFNFQKEEVKRKRSRPHTFASELNPANRENNRAYNISINEATLK
jgi:hypothetical protein